MFYQNISGDDATVALMAKHILHGENLPVFFYRQSFMGSLNGFHLVPALAVFGPSVLLVRLNAVAWSLLFPLGLYVLAGRLYDEATARVTLLLAAVPPFLLTYYSTVAEPHFEANTFGVVLVLLALGALGAGPEPRRARILGCLGFVAGLACWTNMKVVVVLGPILVALLVQEPRLPLRRGGWLLAGGFVLGNLPAWLFYLTQPDPGQGNLGSARRFLEADVDLSWARIGEFLGNAVPLVVGTYYWDHDTRLRALILGLCGAIYAAAVVLAGIEAVGALRHRRRTRRAWGVWLLLLTLGATYVALYGSTFNLLRQMSRARYLLPAYIPLLVFVGAAIVRLSRRSRVLAGAVLALVLAFHLWTNWIYLWPLRPGERARRGAEIAARAALGERLQARPAEALLVDDPMESLRWQFLLSRPRISALLSEVYYPAVAPGRRRGAGDDPRVPARRVDPRRPRDAGWHRDGDPVRRGDALRRRSPPGPVVPAGLARRLACRGRAGDAAGGGGRRPRDGLAVAASRPVGGGPARGRSRRAADARAPRPLARGAHRRARAAGGRRLAGRGPVGASRIDAGAGGAAALRRRAETGVPASQRLARARDGAAARSLSPDPARRARLGRRRDGG